jgi:hypothetical protein
MKSPIFSDFRILCEQVGHHPPVTAFHASDIDGGKDFVFRGSMYPKVKFWGKSVEFQPKGVCTVDLPQWNESYTWFVLNFCFCDDVIGKLFYCTHKEKHKMPSSGFLEK